MSEIIEDHDTEQARSALLYIHLYRKNPRWVLDTESTWLWGRVADSVQPIDLTTGNGVFQRALKFFGFGSKIK